MDDKAKATWSTGQARGGSQPVQLVANGTLSGGMAAGWETAGGATAGGMMSGEQVPAKAQLAGKANLDSREVMAFVEMNASAMVLTDPNMRDNPIVFANRPFLDLTGYDASELVGRNCRLLQGVDTDADAAYALKEAVEKRCPAAIEILNYKKDGTPFWNLVHISPLYDPTGELVYFCALQLDITRRREVRQAFRQAEKMETLGQLTAGLAHNFNNLLHVVTGSLELLKGKSENLGFNRHVSDATIAAERVSKITNQLLAFGRRAQLVPKAIDLGAFVSGRRVLLQQAVGQDIRLRINASRTLPLAFIDPTHLETAIVNVLDNARSSMPHGGSVAITASVMRSALAGWPNTQTGECVALSISDEGEGMSAEVRERASEPFFTTRPTGQGSGLGLSMVHGFVRQSLGRLEIDSDPGYGTTVRIIFPTIGDSDNAHVDQIDEPNAHHGRATEKARSLAKTILVVEDNDDVLTMASDYLSTLGYRILPARNGDEALQVVSREADRGIDLLFTDIFMPGGINGLVLANEVNERLPNLPVLFTTGDIEDILVCGTRTATAIDVLNKPYRCSELGNRVRAALTRGH